MRNESERLNSSEIGVFELLDCIWQRKLFVILTAAVVTGLAILYAWLATPIYEAKVFVQPPSQDDIAQLNYGRGGKGGLNTFTIRDVYAVYSRNLQSESLRREFFRKYYLPSLSEEQRKASQDSLYNSFANVLTLGVATKELPDRFFVKASLADPQQAAQWVVRYTELAGERAEREVIKDARAGALVKADNLEQQINADRESAKKRREDRIIQLTEALRVARSVSLEKPPIIANGLAGEVTAGMDGSLAYMRGSKALEAEIDNLRNRVSDDAFIANLRERQEQITFLRKLKVDPAVIQVYRQDGAMESPDSPVKPKKFAIIVLGGLLGVILGIVFSLLLNFRRGLGYRK